LGKKKSLLSRGYGRRKLAYRHFDFSATSVIAGGAGGQQEGLQYNREAAWWKVIGVYIISADEKKLKLALLKRS
jgi:hypothetical protein